MYFFVALVYPQTEKYGIVDEVSLGWCIFVFIDLV